MDKDEIIQILKEKLEMEISVKKMKSKLTLNTNKLLKNLKYKFKL